MKMHALVLSMLAFGASNAVAFGLGDLTTPVLKGASEFDPTKRGSTANKAYQKATATSFSISNKCADVLDVEIEYIPVGRNTWKTARYVFSPGEKGFLVKSKNRYFIVSATSRNRGHRWNRKQVDTGPKMTDFTYSLSCK